MNPSWLLGGLAAALGIGASSILPVIPAPAEAPRATAQVEYAPPTESTLIVRQPGGASFRAQLTPAGAGGYLEVDGYTVLKGADGWWRYASAGVNGRLTPSRTIVGAAPVPAELAPRLGRSAARSPSRAREMVADQLAQASQRAARMASRRPVTAAGGGPVIFKFPVLLLATWWDADAGQTEPQFQPGSDTVTHFKDILDGFGGNPSGSLTEFYFENSYGQFLVEVDVFGPFPSNRSREDRCYYGNIDPPEDPVDDLDPVDTVLGVGGLGAAGMAIEVVPQADPFVDFAPYDNDGDGYVDFMGIVHSGADMATTGDPCHTWSHALPISAFSGIVEGVLGLPTNTLRAGLPTLDGVLVDRVFTMPEFAERGATLAIGVATHEMAHALGEPDYYAVNGSSSGDGDWDVMSGGSYLGNPSGVNPSWFNPASRVFQGWVTPTLVHGDLAGVRLQPRERPVPGYQASQPHPNLLLVPTRWIKVGEADADEHVWTAEDVYGLVADGDRGYVIEGWYLEYASRMAGPHAPMDLRMSRSPYFDRGLHGSGLLVWHFDYWRRANTYGGSNNAQDDANRMQMDVEEFDFYDDSQDIARNLHRGEASDLFLTTATGLTSGTHQPPPGVPTEVGEPQGEIALSGTTLPVMPADAPFTVDDNEANHTMRVRVAATLPPGDCKLQLFRNVGGELVAQTDEADSGTVAEEELLTVTDPEPGEWVARVADFAACVQWEGSVAFEGPGGFDVRGSADTWSNETQQPTGWAFTNIRGGIAAGIDFAADSGAPKVMQLDLLQLADRADVSPGYARPAANAAGGRNPVNAGRANRFEVPVFSNGGVAPGRVRVVVRHGRNGNGRRVATGTLVLGAYERKTFAFDFDPLAEGPYELSVSVDPDGAMAEGSEANNEQTTAGWAGPANPAVLVVDDEGYTDGEQAHAGALAALGIPYAIATGHVTAAQLEPYEAVIWAGATDRGPGQLDEGDRAAIAAYLAGGGRVWLSSNRAAGALEVEGAQDFLRGWFGADSLETTTLEKAYTVRTAAGDSGGFIGGTPFRELFELQPYPVRPFSDIVGPAAAGVFGDAAGILTLEVSHKPGRDGAPFGTRVIGDAAHGDFRTVMTPFALGQASSADIAVGFTRSVMDFFGVAGGRYEASPDRTLVYHVALRSQNSDLDTPVWAVVLGGREGRVSAFWRRHGNPTFHRLRLLPGSEPGAYTGILRGNALTPAGVDYYIEAFRGAHRGFHPALAGEAALYHAVAVAVPEVQR